MAKSDPASSCEAGERVPPTLAMKDLAALRAKRCRLPTGDRISCEADAVSFLDERGYALLATLAGIPLPSLSAADADASCDSCGITDRAWAWKETLPARKLCAYGKLIRGRGTFISWRILPAFFALHGPAGDLTEEYEAGRMSRPERAVVELVRDCGPLDSRELWQRARPLFGGKRHRFTATLDRLQARFFLTVAGGSLAGWSLHYWDLVERQAPAGLLENPPSPEEARRTVLAQTIENSVAISRAELISILRWTPASLQATLDQLCASGAVSPLHVEGERQPRLAWADAVQLAMYGKR